MSAISHYFRYPKNAAICLPRLPLVHNCKAYVFRELYARTPRLTATHCSFPEPGNLIFTFYGKPAYRTDPDAKPNELLHEAVVSLVLNSAALPTPLHVYPFDTGAAFKGVFDPCLSSIPYKNFALVPTMESPSRIVSAFFGDNRSYFEKAPNRDLEQAIDSDDFESRAYIDLITTKGQSFADDRCAVIEVSFGEDLELNPDTVEAIVCPKKLSELPAVQKFAASNRAELIAYDYTRSRPSESYLLIASKVKEYLSTKSML